MRQPISRRQALSTLGALGAVSGAALCGLAPRAARAHEYPEAYFTVIHPWVPPAKKGTAELTVSMRIIQITRDDRLLSARTEVGDLSVWVPPALRKPGQVPGIALRSGHELTVNLFGPHLVLWDVNTDLVHGAEYPMSLQFEHYGEVEAALIVGEH